MRYAILLLFMVLGVGLAQAQDAAPQDDRGYLQSLIEDNLSTEDTQVRIEGFNGSLFAASSIDQLTIADVDGVWLTMTGLKLDWSRAALLSRRLEVTELSVQNIVLDRLPPGKSAPPSAEAKPFKLPELPLEVDIKKISAGAVALGPSVLGTAATLSLDGSATLSGGAGKVGVQANRTDGPAGSFRIAAGYSNETQVLDLDILLDEAPGGLAAHVLKLEGRPAVRLAIAGSAPLSEFEATLDLQTDGIRRVSGQVTLASVPGDTADQGQAERPPARKFSASLSGDVAPLVAPALTPFFGDSVALSVDGLRLPDGRVRISSLSAETAALRLGGTLDLAANGLPERFDLSGRIAGASGEVVVLPLPGLTTSLTSAEISARFDAATGDAWQASATVRNFTRDGLSVGTAVLNADGTIATSGARAVSANLGFAASGIDHTNADLARAMGTDLSGLAVFDWTEGVPLQLLDLQVEGAGLLLQAAGTLDNFDTGLTATGAADLKAAAIERFSGLAGRDIAGGIDLHGEGSGMLLGGAFDLSLSAEATDLVTGTPRIDALLTGESRLRMDARRDETGTQLSLLTIRSQSLGATAKGSLSSAAGQLNLQAVLADLSQVEASLAGPASLDTALTWQKDGPLRLSRLQFSGAGAELNGTGQVDPADDRLPASGQASLRVQDLSRFSTLAGRTLSGSLRASVQGSGQIRGRDFDLALDATGEDLGVGIAEVNRLLAGSSAITAQIARLDGQYSVGHLDLETPALTAEAHSTAGPGSSIEVSARLANVGLFAPDFPGPAQMQGTAEPSGQDWNVALDGTGPGGTTAKVEGLVAGDLADVDLAITGSAPLGMTNPFIAPRSLQGVLAYDLQLTGRPDIGNLSGRLSTSGARLSAPTLNLVLTDIDGSVALSDRQAQLGLSARSRDGGGIRAEGTVSLRPGYSAALTVALSQFVISDPSLYRTTLDGNLSIEGPLTGGGRISGIVDLGTTEVQVTTAAAGNGDLIPGLIHLHEPADSRRTRERAGLLVSAAAAAGAGGPGFGLDLLVRAPNQIFIRGRGLDAEFGGQVRLSGTTGDVIPVGQFELVRGRLDLLGKRFDLTEGRVSIQGSLDPYMRLVAETVNDDITSRIVIEGQVSAPEVHFESDPELPEDEVVAQLLFGRDMTTLSPFQAIQLAGAVATLTGSAGGGLVSGLRGGIGLDDLDISSTAEGETQVRAGKYLTDELYSDISVDSAGKTEVNLNLDLNSRLKVRGRVTSEGDTGIGIFYQRDY